MQLQCRFAYCTVTGQDEPHIRTPYQTSSKIHLNARYGTLNIVSSCHFYLICNRSENIWPWTTSVWVFLAKRILTCHQGTAASTFVENRKNTVCLCACPVFVCLDCVRVLSLCASTVCASCLCVPWLCGRPAFVCLDCVRVMSVCALTVCACCLCAP